MANIVFNGFTKDEIVILYKFICLYNSEIKNALGKLSVTYPKSSNWDTKIAPESLFHLDTTIKIQNLKINLNDKRFFFCNHKGTIIKSFLFHIYQAVTNGNIKKVGKNVIIDRLNQNSTAFGQLNAENLFSVINSFLNK